MTRAFAKSIAGRLRALKDLAKALFERLAKRPENGRPSHWIFCTSTDIKVFARSRSLYQTALLLAGQLRA